MSQLIILILFIVILSELAVTHILALMGSLFTTAKLLSVSFCHFYAAINQPGLFARSVREGKSYIKYAQRLLALCNADSGAFWGVSHGDATANNPVCKECRTPAALKVLTYTHT